MNRSAFSKDPVTLWEADPLAGDRVMRLVGEFTYTDSKGVRWTVPDGAWINGATIPRALWSAIGSPFAGNYRLASIVHDYFVGEGDNPPVSPEQRDKADRMFFEACRDGGCSESFATLLYIGVRLGSWMSREDVPFRAPRDDTREDVSRDNPADEQIRSLFWRVVDQADTAIQAGDLEVADRCLNEQLGKAC